MNREELIKILHATETPDKIAKWLREQYFPEIMNRYNSEASRKRFGLYRNEQIPSNERNLTDVRMIIPGLFEPPVRTLRATIPENESHIFR